MALLSRSTSRILATLVQSTIAALIVAITIHYVRLKFHVKSASDWSEASCSTYDNQRNSADPFKSLEEFYPFYLCEHKLPLTKLFHFLATFNAAVFLSSAIKPGPNSASLRWLVVGVVQAYTFAWISHFFIEQNRPATFKYPVYSFVSDWIMFKDVLTGKFPLLN